MTAPARSRIVAAVRMRRVLAAAAGGAVFFLDAASGPVAVGVARPFDRRAPPPELLARHNRVLELRLTALRRERVASEQDRIDSLRRQLRLEVELESASALERAERQRRRLEIRIEEPDASGAQ